MNGERITKEVLNMKIKGKCPRGRLRTRWGQQIRKDFHTEGRKLRRSIGKAAINGLYKQIQLLGIKLLTCLACIRAGQDSSRTEVEQK
jgi:hypothetical protein